MTTETALCECFDAVAQASTVNALVDALSGLAREAKRQNRKNEKLDLIMITTTARELRTDLLTFSRGTITAKAEIVKLRTITRELSSH
jgi:hypothetical protein